VSPMVGRRSRPHGLEAVGAVISARSATWSGRALDFPRISGPSFLYLSLWASL
jgi:hypothetical protein